MFHLVNKWTSFILKNENLYVVHWEPIVGAGNTSKVPNEDWQR